MLVSLYYIDGTSGVSQPLVKTISDGATNQPCKDPDAVVRQWKIISAIRVLSILTILKS